MCTQDTIMCQHAFERMTKLVLSVGKHTHTAVKEEVILEESVKLKFFAVVIIDFIYWL